METVHDYNIIVTIFLIFILIVIIADAIFFKTIYECSTAITF
jgi:hypothetical protein